MLLLPVAWYAEFFWLPRPEVSRLLPEQPVFVAAGDELVADQLIVPQAPFSCQGSIEADCGRSSIILKHDDFHGFVPLWERWSGNE